VPSLPVYSEKNIQDETMKLLQYPSKRLKTVIIAAIPGKRLYFALRSTLQQRKFFFIIEIFFILVEYP
jgi:hypothetical protein